MYKSSSKYLSVNALSETLADGVVKRWFKEISSYQEDKIPKWLTVYDYIERFNIEISSYKSVGSKAKVKNYIERKYYSSFWSLPLVNQFNDIYSECLGFIFQTHVVIPCSLLIDTNKPHRSKTHLYNVGFTEHVVSRLLYRHKPKNLFLAIQVLANIVTNILLDRTFSNDEDQIDIIIPGFGLLVLKEDKTLCHPKQIYVAITFVDEEKLAPQQVKAGLHQMYALKQRAPDRFDVMFTNLSNYVLKKGHEHIEIGTLS